MYCRLLYALCDEKKGSLCINTHVSYLFFYVYLITHLAPFPKQHLKRALRRDVTRFIGWLRFHSKTFSRARRESSRVAALATHTHQPCETRRKNTTLKQWWVRPCLSPVSPPSRTTPVRSHTVQRAYSSVSDGPSATGTLLPFPYFLPRARMNIS